MMMTQQRYTILGAGIAGLAAAIALAKQGHHVSILEKAKTFDPIGAGIQLGPNAVRALQKMGAWDAVQKITTAPPALHFRSATSDRLLKEIKLGVNFERRFGQPYRVAHRADLHASLLEVAKALPQVTIKMNVTVELGSLTGPVIAADGLWSKSREQLFPGTAATSHPSIIFRALIDMPQISGVNFECVNLWFYPGAHVVHYPAGQARKLNIVLNGANPQLAQAANTLRELISKVPEWTQWTAAYVNPLLKWHKANVMLIGDAAHGTLPYLAQGAAMSLEDAAALLITTDPTKFEELRVARCTQLHQQSWRNGQLYHLSGLPALMRNAVLRLSSDEIILGRMAWIYNA